MPVEEYSVWLFFPGRLDIKVLAKWFDVRISNPFCTVWNVLVIQDEFDWVSCSPLILADKQTELLTLLSKCWTTKLY